MRDRNPLNIPHKFKPGDRVLTRLYTNEPWVPGVVTAIEPYNLIKMPGYYVVHTYHYPAGMEEFHSSGGWKSENCVIPDPAFATKE